MEKNIFWGEYRFEKKSGRNEFAMKKEMKNEIWDVDWNEKLKADSNRVCVAS